MPKLKLPAPPAPEAARSRRPSGPASRRHAQSPLEHAPGGRASRAVGWVDERTSLLAAARAG